MTDIAQSIERIGFAVPPRCLDESTVQCLHDDLGDVDHSQRNLLSVTGVRDLAASQPVREIIGAILGATCFAV